MSSIKDKAINSIIEIEGGYTNDKKDSGGATKYGITEEVARRYGYISDMKLLPKSLAFEIYSKRYWDSMMLDEVEKLSKEIASEMIDIGINQGVGRASEFLQRSLNVLNNNGKMYSDLIVDGDIGAKTIMALKSYMDIREDGEVIAKMLNALQGAFYITLAERRSKDERFIYGWFKHRV